MHNILAKVGGWQKQGMGAGKLMNHAQKTLCNHHTMLKESAFYKVVNRFHLFRLQ